METEEIWSIVILSIILLVLSWVYKKFPPKKINYLYGYRTRRTMANPKIWKVANTHSAEGLWRLSICLTLLGAVLIVFKLPYSTFIYIGFLLVGLLVTVLLTEKHLDKHFDKNGNPK